MVRRTFFVFLFFQFLQIYFLFSQIHYNLYSSKNEVFENEVFQISIEIINNANVEIEVLNKFSELYIKQSGVSTSFSIINGKQTFSQTVTFLARISKEGNYKIGPFRLYKKNDYVDTDVIQITVKQSPSQNSQKGGGVVNSRNGNYFLVVESSSNKAKVGQFIDFYVKFYTRVDLKFTDYRGLQFPDGSWVENIKSGNDYKGRKVINNRIYDEYEIEAKRVYFSKGGNYTINPVMLGLLVMNDSNFFAIYTDQDVIFSNDIKLQIENLEDSSVELIGNFSIDYKLSDKKLKQNSPFSLVVTIKGEGNFYLIQNLKIDTSGGFEIFSSKSEIIKENEKIAGKRWDILLTPKKYGELVLKIESIKCYNPKEKKYYYLEGKTFNLTVQKDIFAKDSSENRHSDEINVSKNISKNENRKKSYENKDLTISMKIDSYNIANENIDFYLNIIIVLLVSIFVFIFIKFLKEKININISLKNRYEAQLKKIENIGLSDKNIIEKLYQLLETFISEKYNINKREITKNYLKNNYKDKIENIDLIISIIEKLEMFKYGGMELDKDQLAQIIKDLYFIVK